MNDDYSGPAYVFVSYASEDRERVVPFIEALTKRGIIIWWDGRIDPGSAWRDVIQYRGENSACVLVFWSHNSVKKTFVRDEAARFSQPERTVRVPVLLDGDVTVPVGFGEDQSIDLSDWPGGGTDRFERLVGVLKKCLARGPHALDPYFEGPGADRESNIDGSLAATGELRDRVRHLGSLAEIANTKVPATADLDATLGEIDKTYAAVNRAIKAFLKPAAGQGEIDPAPYLELERDGFRSGIHGARGHCSQIEVHYAKEDGIRQWLQPHLTPVQMTEADQLFQELSESDYTMFERMEDIAEFLKNQSIATVNLLYNDRADLARVRIGKARAELLKLEDLLAQARSELQALRSAMGFQAAAGPGDGAASF